VFALAGLGELEYVLVTVLNRAGGQLGKSGRLLLDCLRAGLSLVGRVAGEPEQQRGVYLR